MIRRKRFCLLVSVLALSVLAIAVPAAFAQDTKWEKSTAAGMEAYQEGRYGEANFEAPVMRLTMAGLRRPVKGDLVIQYVLGVTDSPPPKTSTNTSGSG